jgi:hypothetical protein
LPAVAPYGDCTDATAFQLLSVDPKDPIFLATLTGYKSVNPDLKVLISVGGWNFPAGYFSAMASTAANRAIFIASVKSFIQQYSLDGVDIGASCSGRSCCALLAERSRDAQTPQRVRLLFSQPTARACA